VNLFLIFKEPILFDKKDVPVLDLEDKKLTAYQFLRDTRWWLKVRPYGTGRSLMKV
jgi:hypothetical protein